MGEQLSREIAVSDPLSEVTRGERKTLLGASAIGIVIVKTGLVPSKISALGIEFAQTDQRALLLAIGAIVAYFLCAFMIYAVTDFMAWRYRLHKAALLVDLEYGKKVTTVPVVTELDSEGKRRKVEVDEKMKELHLVTVGEREGRLNSRSYAVSKLRAVFEFIVPVIIAIYAIFLLWTHRP